MKILTRHVVPLLLGEAVNRTGDDHIPGSYCESRHVWILNGSPIVERGNSVPAQTTKTESNTERDDDAPAALLEMATKTDAVLERDDDSTPSLIEMMTKTKAEVERDDDDGDLRLLELSTKTSIAPERDD